MDFLPDSDLVYIMIIRKGRFDFGAFGLGENWYQCTVNCDKRSRWDQLIKMRYGGTRYELTFQYISLWKGGKIFFWNCWWRYAMVIQYMGCITYECSRKSWSWYKNIWLAYGFSTFDTDYQCLRYAWWGHWWKYHIEEIKCTQNYYRENKQNFNLMYKITTRWCSVPTTFFCLHF